MSTVAVRHEVKEKFFREALLAWWSVNKRDFPWRNTSDPYEILIAELLLRRTNASAAQTVYLDFLKKYPTALSLSNGRPRSVEAIVSRLGLNWRAQNVVELARHFRSHGPDIPESLESLSQLPGVGPYIARAVLVNCAGLRAVPVDSNVVRVVCRFLGLPENDALRRNRQFQILADSFFADGDPRLCNYALLDFASSVCRARSPKCSGCPLATECKSRSV